jgi:hypothetical protein
MNRGTMGLFTPKSKKDMAIQYAATLVGGAVAKRAAKVVGATVAGLMTVTAASAAISAVRDQGQS